MKRLIILLSLTIIMLTTACREQKSIEQQMQQKTTVCYHSISNTDTAFLSIDTAAGRVIGLLEFHYTNDKKKYKGQFEGSINKDTLKGHFDFKVNDVDKWYRNPVAFLKRNDKYIMGVGKFSMVWGSAYFDQKVPVNYEGGRFIFEKGDCEFRKR